jgi:hypothetical protein
VIKNDSEKNVETNQKQNVYIATIVIFFIQIIYFNVVDNNNNMIIMRSRVPKHYSSVSE